MVRNEDFVYNPRISVTAPVGPVNRNKLGRNGVMSPLYTVFRTHDIDTIYLEWFFKSSYWHSFMFFNGDSGARSDRFSIKDAVFFEMPIPAPSHEEQHQIGAYLDNLDDLITLHLREWLGVAALCQLIVFPLMRVSPQKTKTYRSFPFINAWEQRKVSDVANRFDNLRIPVAANLRIPGMTPYYGANGIQDYVDGFTHDGEFVLVAEDGANDLKNYPVKCVNGRIWVNNHAHVLQSKQDLADNQFLAYSISQADIESLLVGGGRAKLNAEVMMGIELIIPGLPEQIAIGRYLRRIDNLITLHQRKLILLHNIKNGFLNRMFGKIYSPNCNNIETEMDSMATFRNEADFENALIQILTSTCGWEKKVLEYKTEKDLLQNWAAILFENNRSIDRLNDYPLTDGEMQQILEQINTLRTPLRLNGFINGRSVSIKRDNPNDQAHFGKEISLKIYDRQEIAAGQSRYQIARQPKFSAKSSVLPDRRGDFMLLINGMPVIHVELKKSGIPISQAYNQIEKYAKEGVFTGLFSLVQVFVAMNPDEAVYFANPGPEGRFNTDFYFHWADFNNEPINDWKTLAATFLSIPMAHQLIGFYTVADSTDGILKVMRSYQYYAANKISDTVSKHKWEHGGQRGGYIWHTTGSGKTMTSFKSAQLIASSKDADKVVFLIDRIELGTQSATEYRGFAEESDEIQETEDSTVLGAKLKSNDPANTLIVTSVQKMSNIDDDADAHLKKADLEAIRAKRIVFIVDECHRSTFGDMMQTIKHTFPKALFFGFSGTPIQIENEKKGNTTADVFGNELHRYSIADGIRDRNVLGFDPDKVLTFKEKDIREAVALDKAKASTVAEVFADPKKKKIY